MKVHRRIKYRRKQTTNPDTRAVVLSVSTGSLARQDRSRGRTGSPCSGNRRARRKRSSRLLYRSGQRDG